MSVRVGHPGRPLGGRAATALLAVVLAALVHVLGCAHGPQDAAGGDGSSSGFGAIADAPIRTAPVAVPTDSGSPDRHAAKAADGPSVSCAGTDEPGMTAQQRDDPAAPARMPAPHSGLADPVAMKPSSCAAGAVGATRPKQGQLRSALSIWRI